MSRPGGRTRRRARRARDRLGSQLRLALAIVLVAVAAACRHHEEERPGPTRIVFFAARDGEYALYAVGTDGRGLTRIGATAPTLASEGQLLPSSRHDKLIVPDGDEKLRILDVDGLRDLVAGYARAAAWSRDGKQIAVAGPGPGLSVVEAAGGSRRSLTRNRGDGAPAWSLDGERIAFVRNGVGILVIDADGSE